jgi:hypothetical protein
MDKSTFLAVLEDIVQGFENPTFKSQMAAAKAAGDVTKLMALPMAIQKTAFEKHGLDAESGTGEFKAAGRSFGLDAEASPLLARMKAALA